MILVRRPWKNQVAAKRIHGDGMFKVVQQECVSCTILKFDLADLDPHSPGHAS